MSVVKPQYAGAIAVPITLDGLTNGSYRQSAAIDNTGNLYDNHMVGMIVVTPATGTLAANPAVTLYPYGTINGFDYTDGCSGSDAAFTAPGQLNAPPLLTCGVGSASQVLSVAVKGWAGPVGLTLPFGGDLPQKFGFYAQNNLAVSLAAAPASLTVTGATNVVSSVVTTSASHGLAAGQVVNISGVVGATGLNGWWVVQVINSTTTFTVGNTAIPGAYSSGGTVQPQACSVVLMPNQYQAI